MSNFSIGPEKITFKNVLENTDMKKTNTEKSTTAGCKLGVVGIWIDNFPQQSGYFHSDTASEKIPSESMTLEQSTSTTDPSLSSKSPYEINELIDKHVQCIVDPWVGSLLFMVFKWDKSMGNVAKIFVYQSTNIDIANCLNGQSYPTEQLYFCPMMYTPPPSDTAQIPKGLESFVHLKCGLKK